MPEIRRSQLLVWAAAALLVAAIGLRYVRGQARPGGAAGTPVGGVGGGPGGDGSRREAGGGATARRVSVERDRTGSVVHVAGAVRRPGVYRLPAGARVQDAVRRAGGPGRGANLDGLNLAAPLQDGIQVVVPSKAPGAVPGAGGAAGTDPAGALGPPVSLSSATSEQLQTLDGVGPATAAKILAYREEHGGFRSVDDLGQISGIGPKRLEALRDRVTP
jgi:competence protein ComEA